MFKIGDVIVYSAHGLCKVDDICEKTVSNVTRSYYVLHPLGQSGLTISTPVDNDKVVMKKIMTRDEAEEILESFRSPGIDWIDDVRKRAQEYQKIIKTGDRKKIAKVANTLVRKSLEFEENKRKMPEQEKKMLNMIEKIFFHEMAVALSSTADGIFETVIEMIKQQN